MSIHVNDIKLAYIRCDIYSRARLYNIKEFTSSEYGYSCYPSDIFLTLSEPTYEAVECMKAFKSGKNGIIADCTIGCINVGKIDTTTIKYSNLESGLYFKVTNPQWIKEFIRKHNEILNNHLIIK